MTALIDPLKAYQANSVVFSSTAHGFHWNVEGPLFSEFHELFGEIYDNVNDSIDTIAEWIRVFDIQAPYTLQDFMNNQSFGETRISSNSPIMMTKTLLAMNDKMLADIVNMFDIATQEKQQGLANFLADRQTIHQKWGWFLKSILKPTIN